MKPSYGPNMRAASSAKPKHGNEAMVPRIGAKPWSAKVIQVKWKPFLHFPLSFSCGDLASASLIIENEALAKKDTVAFAKWVNERMKKN